MLVNELKLFFFHVPRTGGTSVNRWFLENGFLRRDKLVDNGQDLPILYGKLPVGDITIELDALTQDHFQYLCSDFVKETLKKVVILRDPAERAFSVYKRMKLTGDRRILSLQATDSFRNWCEEVYALKRSGLFDRPFDVHKFPHDKVSHLLPQLAYVLDGSGQINVDHVLMQSDLSASWLELIKKFGVNPAWVTYPLSEDGGRMAVSSLSEVSVGDEGFDYERDLLFDIYERDFELLVDNRIVDRIVKGKP